MGFLGPHATKWRVWTPNPLFCTNLFLCGGVGLAPLQKCVGDFCCINFGGFCGDFPGGFFLGTFSHRNEEKKSGEKIREKKSGGPKIKICEKSVLPKTDLNRIFGSFTFWQFAAVSLSPGGGGDPDQVFSLS